MMIDKTTGSIQSVPDPSAFGYAQGFNVAGLIHYNARYYNPTTGRFTQPDPLDHTGNLPKETATPYTAVTLQQATRPGGDSLSSFEGERSKVLRSVLSLELCWRGMSPSDSCPLGRDDRRRGAGRGRRAHPRGARRVGRADGNGRRLAWLVEVEAEVVEKLQYIIPATGPSEALEHRLEPRGLRPLTACGLSPGYDKQEQIDTLERARRG